MQKKIIIVLRIIGLISFVTFVILNAFTSIKGALLLTFGWVAASSFALAFLTKLFYTAFFGYLKKD